MNIRKLTVALLAFLSFSILGADCEEARLTGLENGFKEVGGLTVHPEIIPMGMSGDASLVPDGLEPIVPAVIDWWNDQIADDEEWLFEDHTSPDLTVEVNFLALDEMPDNMLAIEHDVDLAAVSFSLFDGAYRAVPYISSLCPTARGLFMSLAWHSFSEGLGQYAPIRLSERCLAALMADTSSYAKGRAGKIMRQLIDSEAVEVLEESCGSRPRLIRVIGVRPSNKRSSKVTKGATGDGQVIKENLEKTTPASSSPPPSSEPSESSKHAELVAAVLAQLDGRVSERTTLALVAELGPDEVKQQLEWLPYRDVSGFRRGPAAAFVTFCRSREPKPTSVPVQRDTRTREEIEADYRRRREESWARYEGVA